MAERYSDIIYAHDDAVRAVAFSPLGHLLMSGGNDGKVRFWDTRKNRLVMEYDDHKHSIRHVAYAPNGTVWASMGREGELWIYYINGDKKQVALNGRPNFVFTPDSRHIVCANKTGRVFLYDYQNGQYLNFQKHDDAEVHAIAVSPNGRYLASGGSDCLVRVWDLHDAKELPARTIHKTNVTSLAFSPDSKILASGDRQALIVYWDMTKPAEESMKANFSWATHEIADMAFDPAGHVFATCGADARIKIFECDPTNRKLEDLGGGGHGGGGHKKGINSISFSPEGKRIASASSDHTIMIWPMKLPSHVS